MFSFNAPYGACHDCKGLGIKMKVDEDLVIPNRNLSINEGAIKAFNLDETNTTYTQIETVCNYYGIDMDIPIKSIKKEKLNMLLYGSNDILEFNYTSKNGNTRNVKIIMKE